MKCKHCQTINDDNATFCRVCGSPISSDEHKKRNAFFNILFWISFPIFCYSLISVIFPIESERFFPGYFGNEGSYHTYYSDPFGINSDGTSYYMEEWMPVVIISGVICGLSYYVRRKRNWIWICVNPAVQTIAPMRLFLGIVGHHYHVRQIVLQLCREIRSPHGIHPLKDYLW